MTERLPVFYSQWGANRTVPFALLQRDILSLDRRVDGFSYNTLNVYLAVCSFAWANFSKDGKRLQTRNRCTASLRRIGRLARIDDERTVRNHLRWLDAAKLLMLTNAMTQFGTREIALAGPANRSAYFSVPKPILDDPSVTGIELAAFAGLRGMGDTYAVNSQAKVSLSQLAQTCGMARNTLKKALSLAPNQCPGTGLAFRGWADPRRSGSAGKGAYEIQVTVPGGGVSGDAVEAQRLSLVDCCTPAARGCDGGADFRREILARIHAGYGREVLMDLFCDYRISVAEIPFASFLTSPVVKAALSSITLGELDVEWLSFPVIGAYLGPSATVLDLLGHVMFEGWHPAPDYVELDDGEFPAPCALRGLAGSIGSGTPAGAAA